MEEDQRRAPAGRRVADDATTRLIDRVHRLQTSAVHIRIERERHPGAVELLEELRSSVEQTRRR